MPDIQAKNASELTDAEFKAIVEYMVNADYVFNVIAEREKEIK